MSSSNAISDAVGELRRASEGEARPGLWVGRVESIDDPRRMNRVKVRVFHIHGDKRQTPTSALPWCEVADFGGGGPDFGSGGRIYPVGSTVWVGFEMGDDEFPVVLGGRRGSTPTRDDKNPVEFLTLDGQESSKSETPWVPNEGNELPSDVFADSADGDNHPTRTVWNKSFRGHTIMVEDREGREWLKIIDRAGQVIEMNCRVSEESNANNAAQRGSRNALDDNQLPHDQLENNRAFIRIKDLSGQEIVLDARDSGEEIRISSRSRLGTTVQQITLSSAKGREKCEIVDKAGNTILLDPNASSSIQIFDYIGNKIEFDQENGVLRRTALTDFEEVTARNHITQVNANREEVIGGDERKKILGNKFTDIINDLGVSVTGFTNLALSGAVDAQVVNASASGVPSPLAVKVQAALGGIEILSQLATVAMHFGTLAGDVLIDTLAGNATMHTDGGNVEVSTTIGDVVLATQGGNVNVTSAVGDIKVETLAGNLTAKTVAGVATLGTDAGEATLAGTTIKIGQAAAFSVPLGEILSQILNALLLARSLDVLVGFSATPVTPSPGLLAAINTINGLLPSLNSLTVTVQP